MFLGSSEKANWKAFFASSYRLPLNNHPNTLLLGALVDSVEVPRQTGATAEDDALLQSLFRLLLIFIDIELEDRLHGDEFYRLLRSIAANFHSGGIP